MLLIQDINTDSDSVIALNHESEVSWSKEAFLYVGHIKTLIQNNNEELLAVLKSAQRVFRSTSTPSPYMHNPAVFRFNTDDETNYQGCMTDGGNLMVIQTITNGDDVYQTIGFKGSRGRFIQELDWICREHNIDNYSDLISESPIRYDTSGADDMLPYESALSYSIRKYEAGEKEPLKYWVNKATMALSVGNRMMATSRSIINYLKEQDDDFAIDWEAFEVSVQVTNNLAVKLVHR